MKLGRGACMHPRLMVAAGVIVVVTAGFVLAQHRGEPAKADAIRTAQVTRGNIVLSVSATGTVEPASMVEVRSRATGTVTRVLVDEGQRVRLGQVLVELNDPDSRHSVESYRAALRSAEAAVAVAQAKLDDLRAGATVYTRQQSEEAVRQAEAALAQAKDNLTRQEQLLRDGYVAQSIVDDARHNVDIAESQLRAARARLSDLIAGSTPAQIAPAGAAPRRCAAECGDRGQGGPGGRRGPGGAERYAVCRHGGAAGAAAWSAAGHDRGRGLRDGPPGQRTARPPPGGQGGQVSHRHRDRRRRVGDALGADGVVRWAYGGNHQRAARGGGRPPGICEAAGQIVPRSLTVPAAV